MTVCSGTREHLELALLEGSELSSAVQAHLSACLACSAEARSLLEVASLLSATPAPSVPAGLTARIVPLALAEAQKGRRQGFLVRLVRPAAAFATAFALMISVLAAAGGALVVSAALTAGNRTPTPTGTQPPATATPSVSKPTTKPGATSAPATEAPATAAPGESAEPVPTPTPEPTDLPRRTPDPVSPAPSGGDSTAPTDGTSP